MNRGSWFEIKSINKRRPHKKEMPAEYLDGHPAKTLTLQVDLEDKLQAKLQDSWITETYHRAKQRFISNRSARAQVSEVGVIENIKSLATELNRGILTQTEILGQRKINPRCRWAINRTSRGIARHVEYAGSAGR